MSEPVIVDQTLVTNSLRNFSSNGLKHYVSCRSLVVYVWCCWVCCFVLYRHVQLQFFLFSLYTREKEPTGTRPNVTGLNMYVSGYDHVTLR